MWIEASLSFTVSQSLLKLMFIESVMPSNHLTLYCPLLLLPSIFPNLRVFSNVLALHIRRPKYWSFSSSPSNEYSGLISFRIDWFDLLAVQGTLKILSSIAPQFETINSSVLTSGLLGNSAVFCLDKNGWDIQETDVIYHQPLPLQVTSIFNESHFLFQSKPLRLSRICKSGK